MPAPISDNGSLRAIVIMASSWAFHDQNIHWGAHLLGRPADLPISVEDQEEKRRINFCENRIQNTPTFLSQKRCRKHIILLENRNGKVDTDSEHGNKRHEKRRGWPLSIRMGI